MRRRFSCAAYRFVTGAVRIQWRFVTHQRSADPAVRDCAAQVRLPQLRSRVRCKWLRSATWRRQCESDCSRFVILLHGVGFWLCDIPLRIGAAQFNFNHPPLLNGREILSSDRNAKILNLIARAADGFAPRRHTTAQILSHGAKISWRLFCVEISAPFRSRYGAEYKFLRRRLVAIGVRS